MFSPALGRVVRCSSTIPTPALCSRAAQQSLSRSTHQRRPSSSKASIPPDGSNGSSSAHPTADTGAEKVAAKKMTGRTGRKKVAAASAEAKEPQLNVPHVPATDYLQKPEVKISSFFSLHRPISLTSTIPPIAPPGSFDSIFQKQVPNSRKSMMANIQTMAGGIQSLEAALRTHENKAEDNIQDEVVHLDGTGQEYIDYVMSRVVPFRPPPAPVPLGQSAASEPIAEQPKVVPSVKVKKRSWSTAIIVTETTDTSGKASYSSTTAPMVEITTPSAEGTRDGNDFEIRQPFLERMNQRQITYKRPEIQAISVKRQRKLKMKKHKYKKLMKRTRLLRRKLDRT